LLGISFWGIILKFLGMCHVSGGLNFYAQGLRQSACHSWLDEVFGCVRHSRFFLGDVVIGFPALEICDLKLEIEL